MPQPVFLKNQVAKNLPQCSFFAADQSPSSYSKHSEELIQTFSPKHN